MKELTFQVEKGDFSQAGLISSAIKRALAEENIDKNLIKRVSIASYEAEINMIIHSEGGSVTVLIDDSRIEITFKDKGPGIPDPEKAMEAGFSTATEAARQLGFGAGMGLPNIKRVSDNLSLNSSSEGTVLTIFFQQ